MAVRIPRHKVFISFHEEDLEYKVRLVRAMGKRLVDRSVDTGSIDDRGLKTTTIRQKIRDGYIRDASVTIVLVGPCTWQRKHVDWEIGASLRKTRKNSRCGLMGILLPNHRDYKKPIHNPRLISPRLADNSEGSDQYAMIYKWPQPWAPARIADWIHRAYLRRQGSQPNNGRKSFGRNWSRRKCAEGWTN